MALNNIIVVSDTHCGCRLGLCPPEVSLDGGGKYYASPLQLRLFEMWQYFWGQWVPEVTHGEPFAVVVNGDSMDGVHHNSVTQISHNLTDQQRIAVEVLRPVYEYARGQLYMVRGTEAHVGKSGQNEEALAEQLGAIPDDAGNYARWDLWAEVGPGLVHITHHIGTTGRTHYESSAVMAELGEAYAEAGRWGRRAPDVVVRSHRHRHIKVEVPTRAGSGISVVTPGWQLQTPFVWRMPGGRSSLPQIGGIIIYNEGGRLKEDHKVWDIDRSGTVQI